MKKIIIKLVLINCIFFVISCASSKSVAQIAPKKATVYTTAENTNLKITQTDIKDFETGKQPQETETFIFVNPKIEFQTHLGIGGAITDASAEVFSKLTQDKQQEFLNAYYSSSGINYNVIRTNINSCDFSSNSYTYVSNQDKELSTFSIDVDKRFKIPLIKKASQLIKDKLVLYCSPWSPPAFMKTNNNMVVN
jgi:glucosylceramidase